MAVKESFDVNGYVPMMEDFLLPRENGMLLSDREIRVLAENNINYLDYKNIKEMLFYLNDIDDADDELEDVINDIKEKDYYSHLVN